MDYFNNTQDMATGIKCNFELQKMPHNIKNMYTFSYKGVRFTITYCFEEVNQQRKFNYLVTPGGLESSFQKISFGVDTYTLSRYIDNVANEELGKNAVIGIE